LDRSALHHISYVLWALVESVYDHALEPPPAPYSIAERWPPIRAACVRLVDCCSPATVRTAGSSSPAVYQPNTYRSRVRLLGPTRQERLDTPGQARHSAARHKRTVADRTGGALGAACQCCHGLTAPGVRRNRRRKDGDA
jgi:hypothetical protein